VHAGQMPRELRPIESGAKKEAHRRSGTVELWRSRAALGHMYLEAVNVLRGCRVGRPSPELGKFGDVVDIVPLSCFAEFVYRPCPRAGGGEVR
jgi:hypothetical protein